MLLASALFELLSDIALLLFEALAGHEFRVALALRLYFFVALLLLFMLLLLISVLTMDAAAKLAP